ncbi:MAG: hypothetical protein NWE98_07190 [Candidatus Bathyarchaeota archaeon]|nr:hypothetical protein [Candidatus Bathyarchaeota archaeon]
MKTWKIATIVAVLALAAVGATFASVFAFGWGIGGQVPYIASSAQASQALSPVTQTNTQVPTLYTPPTQAVSPGYGTGWGWGGCMGRWGWSAAGYQTSTTPLTISQAVDIAKTYVASLNNPDLSVKEVEEYTNNFYVLVAEKSTGNGAFELLINKITGIVTPEPGPNMMWNNKYTFGNGWCNWARGTITATPTVTVGQAKTYAQQYLNSYLPGMTVGDVTAFSGHYTIEVESNGAPYGMLSINSFTGQVWYHTWHGAFIQEIDIS